jgi:enamine deaminase RidA (YjgF/YER057c/UK114 family)
MKTLKLITMVAAMLAVSCVAQGQGLEVKRLQPNEKSPIANGVWAGDTLYLSGQLASPATPADPVKGTPAV